MSGKFCPLNLTPEELIEYTPGQVDDRWTDALPDCGLDHNAVFTDEPIDHLGL